MSYFIIIRGPLGCGKTEMAGRLARRLRAEVISIDEVLEREGLDRIDPGEGCIPLQNFIRANDFAVEEAKGFLGKGRVVIFDGCFYHKEAIEDLRRRLPCPNYVFTLKAPVGVCVKRDRKRENGYGEAAARQVHGLVSRFDYGTVIDAAGPVEESVREILSRLPEK